MIEGLFLKFNLTCSHSGKFCVPCSEVGSGEVCQTPFTKTADAFPALLGWSTFVMFSSILSAEDRQSLTELLFLLGNTKNIPACTGGVSDT